MSGSFRAVVSSQGGSSVQGGLILSDLVHYSFTICHFAANICVCFFVLPQVVMTLHLGSSIREIALVDYGALERKK